ncbi:MAG: aspartate/glutamate racemase family protein [Granulosicoccus sp.]
MSGPVIVINPNSNIAVTSGLDTALEGFRHSGMPAIECVTLKEGPFGIESQLHAEQVVLPLANYIQSRPDAAAFIIACYSDPGIDVCRSLSQVPVFGIQECGVLTALSRGDRFGVIAIAEASIQRHRRYLQRLLLIDRLASERALNMTVDESARGEHTFERLVETGALLIEDGADVLVLGCAGMAKYRRSLEQKLNCPIVEPTQAAVAMAIGFIACNADS